MVKLLTPFTLSQRLLRGGEVSGKVSQIFCRTNNTTSDKSTPTQPPHSTQNRNLNAVEIKIPVPWGHISGKWWGNREIQPVLLLHGWQDNAGSFDNLAPLLNIDSLLAVDMVGHGTSSHYPIGQFYHHVDAVINLRRIVKYYKWDKISIIGHSIGSLLGFAYAGYFPNDVNKFVSIEGARAVVCYEKKKLARDLRNVIDANCILEKKLGKFTPNYSYDEILDAYLRGIHYCVERTAVAPILQRGVKKNEKGDGFYFSRDPRVKVVSFGNFTDDLMTAVAGQITCDVLDFRAVKGYTVEGKKKKLYRTTLNIMEKMAGRLTHYEVDGTHYVHLSQPHLIAPLINNFFQPKSEESKLY